MDLKIMHKLIKKGDDTPIRSTCSVKQNELEKEQHQIEEHENTDGLNYVRMNK